MAAINTTKWLVFDQRKITRKNIDSYNSTAIVKYDVIRAVSIGFYNPPNPAKLSKTVFEVDRHSNVISGTKMSKFFNHLTVNVSVWIRATQIDWASLYAGTDQFGGSLAGARFCPHEHAQQCDQSVCR